MLEKFPDPSAREAFKEILALAGVRTDRQGRVLPHSPLDTAMTGLEEHRNEVDDQDNLWQTIVEDW